MNNFKDILVLCLMTVMVMFGLANCGGGGSSSVPGGGTAGGIFLDSPVAGIAYTSGSTSGTTGADGSFTYEIGKTVTFKLGGVVLGTATPTSTTTAVITPVELVAGATNTANSTVQQIAVFLQTLDSDNNPANGIQIDAATVTAATGQTVNFTNAGAVAALLAVVAPNVTPVTPAAAKAQMDSARLATQAGHYTGVWSGTCFGTSNTGTWVVDIKPAGQVAGSISNTAIAASSTVTGTVTAMGTISASATGAAGNSTWSTTVGLDGSVSGAWAQTGCTGTSLSGSKAINNVATFAGTYQGTYSGADSGSWSATIASNGTATGSGVSALVGAFTLAGTVGSNGAANMAQSQGGASTGAVFSATFNAYGGVTGGWTNGGASGLLSGFRN